MINYELRNYKEENPDGIVTLLFSSRAVLALLKGGNRNPLLIIHN